MSQGVSPAAARGLKYRALRALFRHFGRMRPAARLRLGRWLGALAYRCVRPRVKVARRNLELCFPQMSEARREALLREHFHALAQSVVDRGVLWYAPPEKVREMVALSGYEHLQRQLDAGQSCILLAPHFIGLDAAASRLTMQCPSGATMYAPQSDPAVDAIVREGRTRFNDVHLVSRRDGVRSLLRHIRAARPIYYLPDMDLGRKGAVFVPFFGVPAATMPSTAQIARTWQLPVLPVLSHWDAATGRYHIEVLPPLEDFPGEQDAEAATARLNALLEQWVLRMPAQYYWVHRRFKTRPAGQPKLY
ncbi:lysophospholipid acyltransferase family protein [Orrella sp. JC864]|uniref:lysophospholipid acyltransferase family protein n=1 Tax=Orrella sp. JC864 TaxID=3120298 RepID=UPI0012BD6018